MIFVRNCVQVSRLKVGKSWTFCHSRLKVVFNSWDQNFSFGGLTLKIYGNIAHTPKGTFLLGVKRFEPSLFQIGKNYFVKIEKA